MEIGNARFPLSRLVPQISRRTPRRRSRNMCERLRASSTCEIRLYRRAGNLVGAGGLRPRGHNTAGFPWSYRYCSRCVPAIRFARERAIRSSERFRSCLELSTFSRASLASLRTDRYCQPGGLNNLAKSRESMVIESHFSRLGLCEMVKSVKFRRIFGRENIFKWQVCSLNRSAKCAYLLSSLSLSFFSRDVYFRFSAAFQFQSPRTYVPEIECKYRCAFDDTLSNEQKKKHKNGARSRSLGRSP